MSAAYQGPTAKPGIAFATLIGHFLCGFKAFGLFRYSTLFERVEHITPMGLLWEGMALFYKHVTPQAGFVADFNPVRGCMFIERSENSNFNPVGVA